MKDEEKSPNQLLEELATLREKVAELEELLARSGVEAGSRQDAHQYLCHCVREEVWKMRCTSDIDSVLKAVVDGLEKLSVPFLYCGVNVIDASTDPPSVTAYSMRQERPPQTWQLQALPGGGPLVQFWKGQKPVYRPDLDGEDPYGEKSGLPAMRSVVDVPFSHGTLAASSPKPNVFSAEDLHILQDMAQILSEGFRRMEDLQALERRNQVLEREVDERRQVQEELQRSLAELEQTQIQLVQSEKLAAVGDLVAGVAHELNSPMGAIHSMVDTLNRSMDKLQRTLAADFPREYESSRTLQAVFRVIGNANQVIASGTQRVREIVLSLRHFARLDEGEYSMANLHEGLESTLTLLQLQMGENITVVRDYGTMAPTYCAPGQLNQVFMHLLKNAIQAIEDKGEIRVKTFQEEKKIYIKIGDTGVGIPAERLQRLFDFGFRRSPYRVKMGFGLLTSYKIVKEHQGDITVESTPGQGTEVTLCLPLRESDVV